MLAPDDRRNVCKVTVDETYGSPAFQPSVAANPVGGPVAGAAAGAVSALPWSLGPQAIIMIPLGAAIGASYGAACSAANISHPNAEADFERLLHDAASAGSLKQALESDLNLPRAGCARAQDYGTAHAAPDTIIEVQKVGVMMGCAFGKQEYWISVKWRAVSAANQRMLGEKTTLCWHASSRDFDAWFADPDQARAEIERVLAKTGQRIASELLSSGGIPACRFRTASNGEIEER